MSAAQVIELKGSRKYLQWMEENAGLVEVLEVRSTEHRWTFWTCELNYSVVYRERGGITSGRAHGAAHAPTSPSAGADSISTL